MQSHTAGRMNGPAASTAAAGIRASNNPALAASPSAADEGETDASPEPDDIQPEHPQEIAAIKPAGANCRTAATSAVQIPAAPVVQSDDLQLVCSSPPKALVAGRRSAESLVHAAHAAADGEYCINLVSTTAAVV